MRRIWRDCKRLNCDVRYRFQFQVRSEAACASALQFRTPCSCNYLRGARRCWRTRVKDWIVLENCRLISNPANDGDSFHASAGAREYIFRLYLVDAPETDAMTPGR